MRSVFINVFDSRHYVKWLRVVALFWSSSRDFDHSLRDGPDINKCITRKQQHNTTTTTTTKLETQQEMSTR